MAELTMQQVLSAHQNCKTFSLSLPCVAPLPMPQAQAELARHKRRIHQNFLVGDDREWLFEKRFAKAEQEISEVLKDGSAQNYRAVAQLFVQVSEELRPFYADMVCYQQLKLQLLPKAGQNTTPIEAELSTPLLSPLQPYYLAVFVGFDAISGTLKKHYFFTLNEQTKAWLLAHEGLQTQTALTFYHGEDWVYRY